MPPLVIPAAPKPSAQIPSPLGAQKAAAPKVGGRSGLVGKVLVPLAPPSKRVGHKVANGCVLGEEAQKELDDLSDALFQLADQDGSGTIQFCEFSSIHRELMRLASDQNPSFSSLSSAATEELEKQFRAMDADFSMFLDREEWNKYMVSLLAVVGPKCFKAMCKAFIQEEDQRKDQWKEKYDNLISARLVERVQAATVLAGRSHAVLDVEAMLDKRADPNFVDGQGGSALLYAAEKADAAFMKRLLAAGASPHLHNKDLAESVHFLESAQMASPSASALCAETLTREILSQGDRVRSVTASLDWKRTFPWMLATRCTARRLRSRVTCVFQGVRCDDLFCSRLRESCISVSIRFGYLAFSVVGSGSIQHWPTEGSGF